MVLTHGCPIYTRDGEYIGELSDVHGSYVQVLASAEAPYWLSISAIEMATGARVTLAVKKDQLKEYRAETPGAA